MLSGITFTCFVASYLVALLLEVSRLFFRMPVRLVILIGFAAAGLFAQTLYLWRHAITPDVAGLPLSTWEDWYLLAAWILAAVYLALAISKPQMPVGIFLLPAVLALLGMAYAFRDMPAFPRSQALLFWGVAHGIMLLLGTMVVSFGFVAGVIYLVQSYRLKNTLPARPGFKLPSLEWLQKVSQQSLVVSAFCIALGLVAGVVLNTIKTAGQPGSVPWTDPVVVTSGLLLIWLVAATVFESCYKPAQQGRKVAYLTVASFIFLAVIIGLLVVGNTQHLGPRPSNSLSLWERDPINSLSLWERAGVRGAAR